MTAALRARIHSENGFIAVVAIAVLAIVLILVSVAATAALRTTDTAHRDTWSRQAVQAAEAGLDTASYRADALSVDLRTIFNLPAGQCVASVSGELTFLNVGGWCPAVEEDLGTGMRYSYRVSAVVDVRVPPTCPLLALVTCTINHTLSRKIVSTGMAGPGCPGSTRCVKRRLLARYTSSGQDTTLLPLVGLRTLQNLSLQLYQEQAGSYRECSSTPPTPSNPASGC